MFNQNLIPVLKLCEKVSKKLVLFCSLWNMIVFHLCVCWRKYLPIKDIYIYSIFLISIFVKIISGHLDFPWRLDESTSFFFLDMKWVIIVRTLVSI